MKVRRPDLIAYTDGGYTIQKNTGASACVILSADRAVELYRWSKALQNSTNNRQELGAIIHVVLSVPEGSYVEIHSDSRYSIGVLSGSMKAKINTDLIEIYRRTIRERKVTVKFIWVRGHSGEAMNEEVDNLCTEAVERFLAGGERIMVSENRCGDYLSRVEKLL